MVRVTLVLPLLCLGLAQTARAQQTSCVADSPERRGEPGCSIVADKPLPTPLASPVLWHIDEFPSLAAAQQAEGPASVAFAAHGSAWLYTIESDTSRHHGGKHRAVVGPLPVAPGRPQSMMVMSAYFLPGQFSAVHTHSGPEAWWVLEGEQCLETTRSTVRASANQGAIVPQGDTMRLVATGTGPRRALVLILHDSAQPGTTRLEAAPPLRSCR